MKAIDRIGKFLIWLLILWIVNALSLAVRLPGTAHRSAQLC